MMHFVEGVGKAASGLELGKLMLLIENTVGAGAQLGGKFEELHVMREFAPKLTDVPIGFCLDTCHLPASGFDIANEAGLAHMIAEADRLLGLHTVPVSHANDSYGAPGSALDEH